MTRLEKFLYSKKICMYLSQMTIQDFIRTLEGKGRFRGGPRGPRPPLFFLKFCIIIREFSEK